MKKICDKQSDHLELCLDLSQSTVVQTFFLSSIHYFLFLKYINIYWD